METFLKNIVRQAGAVTMKYFGKIGVKYTKRNAADVVTEADLESNNILVSAIRKKYPNHGIVSEETGVEGADCDYQWIIDPLDGTRSFATRTPSFSILVAVAKAGRVELAAVYDPVQDELFFAKRGKGAWRNGKKIHCSSQSSWEYSFGCAGAALRPTRTRFMRALMDVSDKEVCWISAFGSTGLNSAYVADGRRDWMYTPDSSIWDYAAPSLLLKEAGCTVTNEKGKPWSLGDKALVAATPKLHAQLLKIVKK